MTVTGAERLCNERFGPDGPCRRSSRGWSWVSVTGPMVAGGGYGSVSEIPSGLERRQPLLERVESTLCANRVGLAQHRSFDGIGDVVCKARLRKTEQLLAFRRKGESPRVGLRAYATERAQRIAEAGVDDKRPVLEPAIGSLRIRDEGLVLLI